MSLNSTAYLSKKILPSSGQLPAPIRAYTIAACSHGAWPPAYLCMLRMSDVEAAQTPIVGDTVI